MTKTMCDRCGREIVRGSKWLKVRIDSVPMYKYGITYDLCDECAKSYENWLKSEKGEDTNE